jgi:hypothetical protein
MAFSNPLARYQNTKENFVLYCKYNAVMYEEANGKQIGKNG